jgi:mannitol/fructose-specific phosphotransferase system IIA component (Ntr-type)
MHLTRYLKPECVQLGLRNGHLDEIDATKDRADELARLKNAVLDELVTLFMETGAVRNRSKFHLDWQNREKLGSTALADGAAVPFIRGLQPRRLGLIFARSRTGVWFDAPDGAPTQVFLGVCSPSYEDQMAQELQTVMTQNFLNERWLTEALLAAKDAHEIIAILASLR